MYRLPEKAILCGSDLRAVTPMEMLGIFFGLRARHYVDTNRSELGEPDYLQARALFPRSRHLHYYHMMQSVQNGASLFEPNERGHPVDLASWLSDLVATGPWLRAPEPMEENPYAYSKEPEYVGYHESGRIK